MRIQLTNVMVNDQARALAFYTEKLGFEKKADEPVGDDRWLTVVSPEVPEGPELLLEPMGFEPAKTFQRALCEAGIPAQAFYVDDIEAEYDRLKALDVKFKMSPTQAGPVKIAIFEDTCGNLIQILQP